MTLSTFATHAAPPALTTAYGALRGLGALLTVIDPAAWASMARPEADDVAQLVYAIASKMGEGLEELGARAEVPRSRPLD